MRDAGLEPGEHDWLELGIAADLQFEGQIEVARDALRGVENVMDVCVQPLTTRRKMLLVSDMDSTIITVECIDELADYAGIKAEIAEITERAMQGELDFEGALRGRVALLKGTGLGANVIPAGPCAGEVSDLQNLGLQALLVADVNGQVSLSPTLRLGACGRVIQALHVETCALSEPVYLP